MTTASPAPISRSPVVGSPPAESAPSKYGFGSLIACMMLVTFVALVPHLAYYLKFHTLIWLSGDDDVFYLAILRPFFNGEQSVRDAFAPAWEHVLTFYPRGQLAPYAVLAQICTNNILYAPVVWRGTGGLAYGAALFIVFRRVFRNTEKAIVWSICATLVLACDLGVTGRYLIDSLYGWIDLLRNASTRGIAEGVGQYRFVSPLLTMPVLLILIWSMLPPMATSKRSAMEYAIGILSFTLLIYGYFYFWTGAAAAIALYGVVQIFIFLLKPEVRSECANEIRFAAIILVAGLLLGAPQIIATYKLSHTPEFIMPLQRMARGTKLAADSPFILLYVRNFWQWLFLFVNVAMLVYLRAKNLLFLNCLAAVGSALVMSAAVTHLEFENFHWNYLSHGIGEMAFIASIVLLLDRHPRVRARVLPLAISFAGLLWINAIAYRGYEAVHSGGPNRIHKILNGLEPIKSVLASLTPDDSLAGDYPANIAILLSTTGRVFQAPHSIDASLRSDEQLHQLHALNAWLSGMSEADYSAYATVGKDDALNGARPEWKMASVAKIRVANFRQLESDNGKLLMARYRPTAILLPVDSPAPTRGGRWQLKAKSSVHALYVFDRSSLP